MTSTLVATGDDGRKQEEIVKLYQAYVLECSGKGQAAMDPEQWLQTFVGKDGAEVYTKAKRRAAKPQRSEDEVRAAFVTIMIDNGVHQSMSLMDRVQHRLAIGDPPRENPRVKKQTAPCAHCGDLMCEWAA